MTGLELLFLVHRKQYALIFEMDIIIFHVGVSEVSDNSSKDQRPCTGPWL